MRTRRTILVVFGALLVLAGAAAGAAAGTMALIHATQRDDGFYTSPTERFETSTSVLVGNGELEGSTWAREQLVGTIRVRATAADQGSLFIGIGPREDVAAWLDGTAYDEVVSVGYFPFRDKTERVDGSEAVTTPPAEQDFWVASVAGTGTQTLTWEPENGRWSLVVMNSDASPGVAVDASAGAEAEALVPVAWVLGAAALLLLAGGVVIMLLGVRAWHAAGQPGGRPGAPAAPATAATSVATGPAVDPGTPPAYPARLDANLDAGLSRWQWLVKWFLAIPHLVVLFFLWLAVLPLTVVAGLVILFTGRYPRSIFDFNVGVLRWTWRVEYYAFNVLGSDRYPPFSLDPDPDYPADLAVDHPERLSRGLVLVKWWLLAIPHYLVVAVFTGAWAGGLGWSGDEDGWRVSGGIGLIGILVLIAMVVLLFTGRYPQPLYDFVLGMNRWSYRVLVYALLMRDEYPPFRLDNGGVDPGSRPAAAPPSPPPDRGGQLVGSTRSG